MSLRLSRRDGEILSLSYGRHGRMQLADVGVFKNIRLRANVETPPVAGNYRRYLSCKVQHWAIGTDFVSICLVVASLPGFFYSLACH